MKHLKNLSDDEIDSLLLVLFNGSAKPKPFQRKKPLSIQELSDKDLLRVRSKNHPDKWPSANLEIYQAAVAEIDRRRKTQTSEN